jgi:hypothetical protein
MKHDWTLLCSNCIINSTTNNISLIEIWEEFTIQGDINNGTILPIALSIVSSWDRDNYQTPDRGVARVSFVTPDGTRLLQQVLNIDITEKKRMRTQVQMGGFMFSGFGMYQAIVEKQTPDGSWAIEASASLWVHDAGLAQPPAAALEFNIPQ